jgi:hypothetical protein
MTAPKVPGRWTGLEAPAVNGTEELTGLPDADVFDHLLLNALDRRRRIEHFVMPVHQLVEEAA